MTSGANNFNDFYVIQLTKMRIKMTNPFFYNTAHRQTATKQPLLAEVGLYYWFVKSTLCRPPQCRHWPRRVRA